MTTAAVVHAMDVGRLIGLAIGVAELEKEVSVRIY